MSRIYCKEKVFKTFKGQISPAKVRIWGPDLICNAFIKIALLRGSGTVELTINAHRRTSDPMIEC